MGRLTKFSGGEATDTAYRPGNYYAEQRGGAAPCIAVRTEGSPVALIRRIVSM